MFILSLRRNTSCLVILLGVLTCLLLSSCGFLVRSATWDNDPIDAMMILRDDGTCTMVIDRFAMEGVQGLTEFERRFLDGYHYHLSEYLIAPTCTTKAKRSMRMSVMVSRKLWFESSRLAVMDIVPDDEQSDLNVLDEMSSVFGVKSQLRRLGASLSCGLNFKTRGGVAVFNAGIAGDVHVTVGQVERGCGAFIHDPVYEAKEIARVRELPNGPSLRKRQELEELERYEMLQEAGILPAQPPRQP